MVRELAAVHTAQHRVIKTHRNNNILMRHRRIEYLILCR
jgi:hypothetical protein